MDKTVIGVLVAVVILVGGFAIYHGTSSKSTEDAMMKDDHMTAPATSTTDAMMKHDDDSMMASGTQTMMDGEVKGDAMMAH